MRVQTRGLQCSQQSLIILSPDHHIIGVVFVQGLEKAIDVHEDIRHYVPLKQKALDLLIFGFEKGRVHNAEGDCC